jgi:hypothetical protein
MILGGTLVVSLALLAGCAELLELQKEKTATPTARVYPPPVPR